MSPSANHLRRTAALFGAAALALAGATAPASAIAPTSERGVACVEPESSGANARGGADVQRGKDHRDISVKEQRAIDARTKRVLTRNGVTRPEARAAAAAATIPVYVHVMRDSAGNGDVTNQQISQQVAVLNKTYGGQESSSAANTGFTFSLAGTYRYNNTAWHNDRQSAQYRSQTRKGGADALNVWLVAVSYTHLTLPTIYSV